MTHPFLEKLEKVRERFNDRAKAYAESGNRAHGNDVLACGAKKDFCDLLGEAYHAVAEFRQEDLKKLRFLHKIKSAADKLEPVNSSSLDWEIRDDLDGKLLDLEQRLERKAEELKKIRLAPLKL